MGFIEQVGGWSGAYFLGHAHYGGVLVEVAEIGLRERPVEVGRGGMVIKIGAVVGAEATVDGAIIGSGAVIRAGARIMAGSVVAPAAVVPARAVVDGRWESSPCR